jgi:two-component system response regulator DevR
MTERARRIRIFILEDEWMWAEAIISVINRHRNMELVGESTSYEAGEAKILALKPDVVLADVRLKGEKTGIQAAREMLKKIPGLKVIIFTVDPEEELLTAAIKAGAHGYLLKKEITEPQTLIRAVEAVARSDAYITPAVAKKVLGLLKAGREQDRYGLSRREREILGLVREGRTNARIADSLGICERTVANHLSNIFIKLDVKNRTQALAKAVKEKLLGF